MSRVTSDDIVNTYCTGALLTRPLPLTFHLKTAALVQGDPLVQGPGLQQQSPALSTYLRLGGNTDTGLGVSMLFSVSGG